MNVYFSEQPEKAVFLHFGLGTLGSAILKELNTTFEHLTVYTIPFSWNTENPDFNPLNAFFKNYIEQHAPSFDKLVVLWSSGIYSMTSDRAQMDREHFFFQATMQHVQRLMETLTISTSRIIFFSSAGGLYEGQVCVSSETQRQPMSWYGISKLEQEEFIENAGIFDKVYILRPSAVYSIDNFKNRMGLIPTIFINGIFNRTTTIYGNPDTLRDYVLDRDIGKYVAQNILRNDWIDSPQNLISGKPFSIFELKHLLERILSRPLYFSYTLTQSNAKHITFKPGISPTHFSSSDLHSNLYKLNASFFTRQSTRY